MLKQLFLFFLLGTLGQGILAQEKLPVLEAGKAVLSIKDGTEWRENYWTISPDIELDVYTADKTNETKTVTFYSDLDSIAFELKPREKKDFVILLNGKDSCFTRIESGLNFVEETAEQNPTRDTIPFTLTPYNNISIQTTLNGKDTVNLMFHTAVNSVSLTTEAMKKITSVEMSESTSIDSWGGQSDARYSKSNSLQIGDLNWDKLTMFEGQHSGHLTDGKFGPHLFDDKIIEINYDKSLLIIHSALPEMEEDFEQLNLIFKRSAMFVKGVSTIGEEVFDNEFLVHTGFGGTLLFDDEFVRQNNIGSRLEVVGENELKDSFGNILKTKKVSLPTLSFGESTFSDIPVGIFEGAISRQKMSVLGGDLLKRFNIIIDLQQAYIYLQLNELRQLPYAGTS